MKILVTAKRVEDPESKIKVKADGSGIVQEGLKYKINPFDEIAVEEGLRLAAKHGGEVVVVSIGPKEVQEQLRHALAMGADQGGVGEPRGSPATRCPPPACSRRSSSARSRTWPSSASRASTTTRTRPASTSPSGSAGARPTFASKVESLESDAEKAKTPAIHIAADGKSAQVVREVDNGLSHVEREAAGHRHHRPAPEPPALRLAPGHHEGQEQAHRGAHPGRAGRRRQPRRSRS